MDRIRELLIKRLGGFVLVDPKAVERHRFEVLAVQHIEPPSEKGTPWITIALVKCGCGCGQVTSQNLAGKWTLEEMKGDLQANDTKLADELAASAKRGQA